MPNHTASPSPIRGRGPERKVLDQLLRDVRDGRSRVLVLRGETGIGKTVLLDYLTDQVSASRVLRTAGVETAPEIAYSNLQQLCEPLLDHRDRLPRWQRAALLTAFGLTDGRPPEIPLLGLAVLTLLAEGAAAEPLVCVVDDVQWLDQASAAVLTFVARRLEAESVALVLAVRSPGDEEVLTGVAELRIEGLSDDDARALLDSVLTGPVNSRVRDWILAEASGNPLALIELPRHVSPSSAPREPRDPHGGPG